jgi:hypothetical protein
MAYKTFRRDRLRRLVEAGKVTLVGSYHFDDMMGESRADKEMPVAMKWIGGDWRKRKQGVCYMTAWDFQTQSGACWQNDDGTVTLIVHGNSNYTFRVTS